MSDCMRSEAERPIQYEARPSGVLCLKATHTECYRACTNTECSFMFQRRRCLDDNTVAISLTHTNNYSENRNFETRTR